MAKKNEGFLDLLARFPWWVSVIASVCVYLLLVGIVPLFSSDNLFLNGLIQAAPQLAPILAIILLLFAPILAFKAWEKRRLLDGQKGIESIRALSWKKFEELVGEAFRREGYHIEENYQPGADGGIDLRLFKDGEEHIVQCKQWKIYKVGVRVVREMYGVMVSEGAASVLIITSGYFTQEAKGFAKGKPIVLIDGPQLAILIGEVQFSPKTVSSSQAGSPSNVEQTTKTCPKCGGDLVLRTAKRGPHAGSKFYGCSSYPKCRFIQTCD